MPHSRKRSKNTGISLSVDFSASHTGPYVGSFLLSNLYHFLLFSVLINVYSQLYIIYQVY